MVQKYDMHSKDATWDDNYEMRAEQHGSYVTLDDYEALEADYNVLQKKYDKMLESVGKIWREG